MFLAVIGIFVSLALLIGLAYRGHAVVWVAPLAATVAVLFAGLGMQSLAHYTQVFMPAAAGFVLSFFPLFVVGAIFGQLMSVSGLAEDLAAGLAKVFGPQRALLVTTLTTALLTYGGVSAWVIVFTMFPIAVALFRLADIPRRLMPAAIALGIFTFATAALPGSPQIHNAIPTRFLGTTTFAAPILGIIGGAVVFALGYAWLAYRQRALTRAGESFSDLTLIEQRDGITVAGGGDAAVAPARSMTNDAPTSVTSTVTHRHEHPHHEHRFEERVQGSPVAHADMPEEVEGRDRVTGPEAEQMLRGASMSGLLLGLLPIVAVALVNALCTYVLFPRLDTAYLAEEKFGGVDIGVVTGIWSVVAGLGVGIVVIMALRPRFLSDYVDGLTVGAKNSVLPVMTTASEVGYGAVIASLAAFALMRDGLITISDNAAVLAVLSTSIISGLTGSASGGLTITLNTFGEQLQTLAADQGISLELVHRVMAMASTGLDSLPHNGAIITLLLVTGLTHRESYKDIFVVTVIAPLVGLALVVGLGLGLGAF